VVKKMDVCRSRRRNNPKSTRLTSAPIFSRSDFYITRESILSCPALLPLFRGRQAHLATGADFTKLQRSAWPGANYEISMQAGGSQFSKFKAGSDSTVKE
jgi:hypothetical protein